MSGIETRSPGKRTTFSQVSPVLAGLGGFQGTAVVGPSPASPAGLPGAGAALRESAVGAALPCSAFPWGSVVAAEPTLIRADKSRSAKSALKNSRPVSVTRPSTVPQPREHLSTTNLTVSPSGGARAVDGWP